MVIHDPDPKIVAACDPSPARPGPKSEEVPEHSAGLRTEGPQSGTGALDLQLQMALAGPGPGPPG